MIEFTTYQHFDACSVISMGLFHDDILGDFKPHSMLSKLFFGGKLEREETTKVYLIAIHLEDGRKLHSHTFADHDEALNYYYELVDEVEDAKGDFDEE